MYELGFLIAIAAFVMVLVAFNKNAKLETRLAQLKLQLGLLADEVAKLRAGPAPAAAPETQSAAEAAPVAPIISEPAPAESVAAEPPAEPETSPAWERAKAAPAPARDMEQTLASRWFVWIGAAAIAVGGVLFVKYAYDNQLISPTLQIILGLILGATLVAAGEFVRRKSGVEMGFVPAALSAGGLVTAFGSIYAAYALYELIAPTPAFVGLAIVAVGALALSRLQGPLIAALGLIGSYITPALIPSEHPAAWNFFPYLLIILVASFATLRGREWWWLGYSAVAGSAIWGALWVWNGPFTIADTLPIGLFAHALGFIAFFGLSGRSILDEASGTLRQPSPQLAIGLAGLAAEVLLLVALVSETDHGGLALILFFAAMAGEVLIAWRKSGLSPLAVVAAALSYVTLMLWRDVAIHEWAVDERAIWTTVLGAEAGRFLNYMLATAAVFTLLSCFGVLLRERPRSWGLAGGASAFLFVIGAWSRVSELFSDERWALISALFAIVLLGAAWEARGRNGDKQVDQACGFLSAGAALLLIFSLDRLLDGVWLSLALAGLAVVFAGLAGPMRVSLHGPIAAGLGSLVTLRLFVSRSLWTDDQTLPLGAHWPLYGYGAPAVLFLIASKLLRAAGHIRSAITLEGLSLGLLISLVSLELRVLIAGGITYEEPAFLEMSAHILTWLGAAYGLMYRQRLFSSVIATWGARILIAVSVGAIIFISLAALNPVVTEEPVPGNVVFNALLLAYLAPVVLIGLIARRLEVLNWEVLRPAAGFLALLLAFVYLTLETKRVFQGRVMQVESLSIAESYAYSAVWLGFALLLFIAGLRLSRQYVRYAGLGVMVLVVLKVFLWDMSSLEGLYRIASFIGLGLCLVGIGWLYQRFVQQPKSVIQ